MRMFPLVLIALVSVSMCTQNISSKDQASSACISLCNAALKSGKYLGNGPCLSESSPDWSPNWSVSDWVCDVAHSPRQDVDNLQENQCSDYRNDKANHFVEVDASCKLIRAV